MANHTGPTRREARYGLAEGGPIHMHYGGDDEPARDRSGIEAAYEHAVEQLDNVGKLVEVLTARLRPLLTEPLEGGELATPSRGGASPHAEALYSLARRAEAAGDGLDALLRRLDV